MLCPAVVAAAVAGLLVAAMLLHMLLLLRALGASAFQCATRPSTDSWRTNVARVPAVAMDLTPEPELDEAMKAMQEVNELRAKLAHVQQDAAELTDRNRALAEDAKKADKTVEIGRAHV